MTLASTDLTRPAGTAAVHPRAGTSLHGGAASTDLFTLGRAACARRSALFGERGVVARVRRLLPSGAWRGPRDAADAYVETADLEALGGLDAAINAGARALVGTMSAELARQAAGAGLRIMWRVPLAPAGTQSTPRERAIADVLQTQEQGMRVHVVIPTPMGEPWGLDTIAQVAHIRLAVDHAQVAADFERLGPRLAQMALAFGADQLFGPIVSERALRLGANANNPALTKREAASLLRGAGLSPHERLADDRLEALST